MKKTNVEGLTTCPKCDKTIKKVGKDFLCDPCSYFWTPKAFELAHTSK